MYIRKTNRKSPTFEEAFILCRGCDTQIEKRVANKKWCTECLKEKYRQNARSYYERKSIKKTCKVCLKTYASPPNRPSKYCSKQCFNENEKIARRGKGNPSYRNGLYTPEKKRITLYKDKAFQKNAKIIRDNQIKEVGYSYCEHCLTATTLRWETHHLLWRSEAPRHANLHHIKNLIRLCIKCHNWFHAKKDRRDKLVEERNLRELFPERFGLENDKKIFY